MFRLALLRTLDIMAATPERLDDMVSRSSKCSGNCGYYSWFML